MALLRKLFYRKPPDGLLEISERVYVFDCCFTTDVWDEENYKGYVGGVISQLRDHYPDASILVFNFRDAEWQSRIANALSEYDMTIMDYPRQYEGCPLLPMEVIHHFLRSSESWLSLGLQNLLVMHCERGGWPVLAFMLAALLIYRKQYSGEQKTLDMVYKQAPRELLHLLSPLNPLPSQLRYLQYISRRNLVTQWPPLDRALALDCVIIRMIPNFDGEGGCRPIFRIYGQDPSLVADRTPKVLFSTPKRSKAVRYYKQAECELVKIDINCCIQGDVVLECISLYDDMKREKMIFRVMFNTAFIRSNILMLNRDEIDILWDAKDQFPKDFRAEVLFSEVDAATSVVPMNMSCFEEKDGLPVEAFAKVHEIFSSVDWLAPKAEAALSVIHQVAASNVVQERLLTDAHHIMETSTSVQGLAAEKLREKEKSAALEEIVESPMYLTSKEQLGSSASSLLDADSDKQTGELLSVETSVATAKEVSTLVPLSESCIGTAEKSSVTDRCSDVISTSSSALPAYHILKTMPTDASSQKELSTYPQESGETKIVPTVSPTETESLKFIPPTPPIPSCQPSKHALKDSSPSPPIPPPVTPPLMDKIANRIRPPPPPPPPMLSSESVSSSDVMGSTAAPALFSFPSQIPQAPATRMKNDEAKRSKLPPPPPPMTPLIASSLTEGATSRLGPAPPPPIPLPSSSASSMAEAAASSRASPPPPTTLMENATSSTGLHSPTLPHPQLSTAFTETSPGRTGPPPPPRFSTASSFTETLPGRSGPPFPPPMLPSASSVADKAASSRAAPPPPPPTATTLNENATNSTRMPPSPPPPPQFSTASSFTESSLGRTGPPPPPPPPLLPHTTDSLTESVVVRTGPPPPPLPTLSPSTPSPKEFSAIGATPPPPPPPPPPPAPPLRESSASRGGMPQASSLPTPPLKDYSATVGGSIPPPPPPPSVSPLKETSASRGNPPPPPPPPMHSGPSAGLANSSVMPPPPPPPMMDASARHRSSSIPSAPPPPLPFKENLKAGAGPTHSVPVATGSAGSLPGSPSPPPPCAPLPGKGRTSLSRTISSKSNQSKKLKPLHWLKLTRAVQGSLWAEAQKYGETSKAPEIDISELESLFSAAVPSSDHGGRKANSRASLAQKPEKVQLIEHRRAYNCEIMLSKVKIPLPDLLASVLALEDSALDVDQVENLIKFCPTKEEMELLKGYKGEKEKLGKCEQFFLELMQVPRIESKLRVFSFKIQFQSQVAELQKNLNSVNSAADQIKSSAKLKRIMQTILSLGNALNQGTARGSAVGFRLDSLLKLTETRARNNKMTLMHYLCKVLVDKLPELLDFSKDLSSLEPASKVQLKFLAEEMQAISKGLEKVIQELSMSENDGPVSEHFCKALKEFLSFAEGEVRSLASLYSGVGRNVDSLILYFGEDPSRCPFEQVISTILNFVRMFNQAHEENCKQLEFERKKAEKEAAAEKLKLNAPEKGTEHIIHSVIRS
ncbi:hypothetical protein ACH5RR_003557 [Cinchona calisaya]|uniref:Formin-like protein n=1 Tax=Cinchona calisaya TaxID=153742 RepID=A0ABD3AV84_9GENT